MNCTVCGRELSEVYNEKADLELVMATSSRRSCLGLIRESQEVTDDGNEVWFQAERLIWER